MPSNMAKRYPGLSLTAASEAAKRDGAPLIAPATLGTYLNSLSAVFNWAVGEDWLERNPAQGVGGKGSPQLKRRGFTSSELNTLFGSLSTYRAEQPARFWLPALALYSGARAGELAQLFVGDVVEREGVWVLDFSVFDPSGVRVVGKRLKTTGSERVVPLHPAIIAAGFLEFATSRGGPNERLFPELKTGPHGGVTHEFSKWFGRHLDRIGLSDPTVVFHSFRHGFRDAGRRARLSREMIDALGGWVTPGVGASYGDRGIVSLLADDIRKIDYPGFVLMPTQTP